MLLLINWLVNVTETFTNTLNHYLLQTNGTTLLKYEHNLSQLYVLLKENNSSITYFEYFTTRQRSCGKVIFSVMSVIMFGGSHVTIIHDALELTIQDPLVPAPTPTPIDLDTCSTWTHHTGTLSPGPAPRHGTSLYSPPPDMFKRVHYELCTVDEQAVLILLECFLVNFDVHCARYEHLSVILTTL